MTTVTSLTKAKIEEMVAGFQLIGMTQEDINTIVIQMRDNQAAYEAIISDFNEVVLPRLREDLAENKLMYNELSETLLPTLRTDLEEAQAQVEDLVSVTIPALEQDLETTSQNLIDRPKVYTQAEEPSNPDEDERYLVVGDVWFKSDDNNRQRVWNGTEWSTFNIDIPDFSVTVKKFMSSTHNIY